MKSIKRITILFLVVTVLTACSRKKSTFMTRNFRAVTAEFNPIYNGEVALEKGKAELALGYKDDFWEILPIERVEEKKKKGKPGEKTNANFNRAEEKAAKAIQKHSLYIDGKEHNPQIDEAYMMLGKARYFDERYVASQDAFNFILNRYPTSNSINQAKMWKAKTNIRLSNEEGALEELSKLLRSDALEKEDRADASAIMAQAYVNLDSIEQALPYIRLASEYVKDNELKGRYSFIKGQIYNRLGLKDSANIAFQEVIDLNRKSPRVYMINAHLEQTRNFEYDKGDKELLLEHLTDMSENRENRPFLDIIHHQVGEFYRKTENIDSAVANYNKSIKKFQDNRKLQSTNYSTLAEIYFDRAEYKKAGNYFDSTLTFMEEKSRPWRRVKKKRENLDDVIKYEDIAILNDSILRIVNMSEAEQVAYFTEYTTKLKAKVVADSIAAVKEQESIANKEFYEKNKNGNTPGGGGGVSSFYFYNSTTAAYGKQEFKKIWGRRQLEDNWRLSSKNTISKNDDIAEASVAPVSQSERFLPETYLNRIPKEQRAIDSITNDRNFAYYQLGLIYKEKFREYNLATAKLEKLLSFGPEERLVLPSKYNLYKIYELLGKDALASKWKNDILTNHPDSRYAVILKNPNTQLATDESSPEFRYKALYKEFEAGRYQYVIDTSDEYITTYTGNDIVPKLEMLKATALAKQDGFEAYKKQLNFVALNYPQSPEGKDAQKLYATVLPSLAKKGFAKSKPDDSWKVIYQFSVAETEAASALKAQLEVAVVDYPEMSVSMDYFDPSTMFVIIHGLDTQLGGRGFAELLRDNDDYRISRPSFEISSPNYKVIQIHKNLDEYLASENTEDPQ